MPIVGQCYLKIMSNDGTTTFYNGIVNYGGRMEVVVSGLDNADSTGQYRTPIYVYTGEKQFLGVSTTPNSTTPDYTIGDIFSVPVVATQSQAMVVYIVEKSLTNKLTVTYQNTPIINEKEIEGDAVVSYKGTTVQTISAGEEVTLNTKDKFTSDFITIAGEKLNTKGKIIKDFININVVTG